VTRPPRRPAPRNRKPSPLQLHAAGPAAAPWLTRAAWAVIAAFAAALLFVIAGPHRVGDVFTETDFYGAYGMGARLVEHGHLDPGRYAVVGPLYEIVLGLVGFVIRDLFVAAELIACASMTLALLLWFRLLRARTGPGVALLATLFIAANAQFFRYGYAATTDALAIALQAGALALLLAGPASARRVAWAGALAGLAFLTRYNAVALLPAGLVALLAGWIEPGARPGRVRGALVFGAGFFAPVLPWMAFSFASGAHFAFQLHHNIAYEVFAHAKGIPWDTYQRTMQSQFPTPWSVLARDPIAVVQRMAFNAFDHVRLDAGKLAGGPLALAAVAGALLGWRDGSLARLKPLWLAMGLLFLTLVPAFHSERYSLSLLPGWAALAAIAFASPRFAFSLDAGAGRRVWLKALLAAIPLALAVRNSVALQRQWLAMLPVEVLQVAREAKPFLRPGDRVMARKPHFAWHAGLEAVPFPFADSLSQIAAVARERHVRWLYYSWPEAEMRPVFNYLLDTTGAVPGLTPRAVTTHYPAVLYEIGPGFGANPAWYSNDTLRAVHRARAQIAITNNDWHSRMLIAIYLATNARYAEAQPLLDEAAGLAPDEIEVLVLQGNNLLRLQSPAAADEIFAHIQRLDPGNPQARLGRGWVAVLEGRRAQAAELWRPVVLYAGDAATLRRMLDVFLAVGDDGTANLVKSRLHELGLAP